jgi:hypothetical protein
LLEELLSDVTLPLSDLLDEGPMSAAEKRICKGVIKEHQKISFERKIRVREEMDRMGRMEESALIYTWESPK